MAQIINRQYSVQTCGDQDFDLRFLHALWDVQALGLPSLRPSDRHAIRQAGAAMQRLGKSLAEMLAPLGATSHRVKPKIEPTTRVREIPKRFRLEITFAADMKHASKPPVIFVEFTPEGLAFGLFAKDIGRSKTQMETWKAFRAAAPDIFRALKWGEAAERSGHPRPWPNPCGWRLSRLAPPNQKIQFPTDANDWLKQRAIQKKVMARSLTISKFIDEPYLNADGLFYSLAKMVKLFAPFLALPSSTEPGPSEKTAQLAAVSSPDASQSASILLFP